jgi:ABC-type uncharacterized transport system permease subunit
MAAFSKHGFIRLDKLVAGLALALLALGLAAGFGVARRR